MKITINGETFGTKKALETRIRAITATLGEIDAEQYAFVSELFSRHPSSIEKSGSGIARITVILAAPYNTHCFQIERTDGTNVDISWRECLRPSTPIDWFRACARSAVVSQIQEAKTVAFANGPIACPITSEQITRATCHVDHAEPWPFVAIADAFIAERSVNPATVRYDDAGTESRFSDDNLIADFAHFHRERAVLRAVSRKANLSTLRKAP